MKEYVDDMARFELDLIGGLYLGVAFALAAVGMFAVIWGAR